MSTYHYAIVKLGGGSDKYGECELCRGHCDTAYLQTESLEYEVLPGDKDKIKMSLTRYGCSDFVGHKQCLENARYPNRRE